MWKERLDVLPNHLISTESCPVLDTTIPKKDVKVLSHDQYAYRNVVQEIKLSPIFNCKGLVHNSVFQSNFSIL